MNIFNLQRIYVLYFVVFNIIMFPILLLCKIYILINILKFIIIRSVMLEIFIFCYILDSTDLLLITNYAMVDK